MGATTQVKDIIGRGVITAIFAKEPIIESRLAPKGAGGGMAAMIPPGMRAVAVRVNEVVGVAGFVVPGTHVDILISGNTPGGNQSLGTLTQTLLQNIEVLSAGQDFKKDAEGKPIMVQVVNMLVTPTQAEQLSLAASQTSIQLVLRNPLDHEIAKTPGTALQHLFANSGAPAKRGSVEMLAASTQRAARGTAAGARCGARPAQGGPLRHGDHFGAHQAGTEIRRNSGGQISVATSYCKCPAGGRSGFGTPPASRAGGDENPKAPGSGAQCRAGQTRGHGRQEPDHRQPDEDPAHLRRQRRPDRGRGGQPQGSSDQREGRRAKPR